MIKLSSAKWMGTKYWQKTIEEDSRRKNRYAAKVLKIYLNR
jgi:hypothetical protein